MLLADLVVPEVAGRFGALVRYAGLRLGRRLGTEVTPALTRRELTEPGTRTQALVTQLASTGTMTASLKIPGRSDRCTSRPILRAGRIVCHVDVDAPREGRPTTRVNWLVRQLKEAPDSVRVEAFTMHARGPGSAELLRVVRANSTILLSDPTKELRSFRVAQSLSAGTKRGTGRGGFIDSLLALVIRGDH